MRRLLKACAAVAIAAVLVAGGAWAALSTGGITAGDHVQFRIEADVKIYASAYLGYSGTAYSLYEYDSQLTNQSLEWVIGSTESPTRLTKNNSFITYSISFLNTGDTPIKVQFTKAESSNTDDYDFEGGYTEADAEDDPLTLIIPVGDDMFSFIFALQLTNRNDISSTDVSFECSVTQVMED